MLVTPYRTLFSLFVLALSFFAAPSFAGVMVPFSGEGRAGTIIVRTDARTLLFVVGNGQAIRYTVGVGRAGKQWFGMTSIASKHLKPAWSPPTDMLGNRPYFVIPSGAPNNPMGAAALVLSDHELAIHGTNNPASIGGFVSSGCIRMHNVDIIDLFDRVSVGTRVVIAR
jgi:lipoprotein-anchoring transpeptidase ErfK/SrfK